MSIAPYGGTLVNRVPSAEEARGLREEAAGLPAIRLSSWALSDLYLIAVGGLSPLEGFMTRDDYGAVVDTMHLPSGLPWSIPVVLPATEEEAKALVPGTQAALVAPDGEIAATIDVSEVFDRDREREAEKVFRTRDGAHPGVAALWRMGSRCVAGPIRYVYRADITGFPQEQIGRAHV